MIFELEIFQISKKVPKKSTDLTKSVKVKPLQLKLVFLVNIDNNFERMSKKSLLSKFDIKFIFWHLTFSFSHLSPSLTLSLSRSLSSMSFSPLSLIHALTHTSLIFCTLYCSENFQKPLYKTEKISHFSPNNWKPAINI